MRERAYPPPTHVDGHFVGLGPSVEQRHHTEGEGPEPSIVVEESILVTKGVCWSDYGGTWEDVPHHLLTICLREGGRGRD